MVRQMFKMTLIAVVVAAGGAFAANRYIHHDTGVHATAAMRKITVPLMAVPARAVVELRQIQATIKQNSPARVVQRITQSVGTASAVGTAGPAARGGVYYPASHRAEWQSRPFGRGAIIERR